MPGDESVEVGVESSSLWRISIGIGLQNWSIAGPDESSGIVADTGQRGQTGT